MEVPSSPTLLRSRPVEAIKASAGGGKSASASSQLDLDRAALKRRLPTAQVPREKNLRQDLFKKMDTNRNGHLSLSEVQSGLPALLEREGPKSLLSSTKDKYIVPLTDLKPAIKCAFSAARKLHAPPPPDKKPKKKVVSDAIDVRGFHALLVAFQIYLELDVLFQTMDSDGDRHLSWREVKQPLCLKLLEEWDISAEMAKTKFEDNKNKPLRFLDFSEWCIARHFGDMPLELDANNLEETLKEAAGNGAAGRMLDAFAAWDKDGDRCLDEGELTQVLLKLDPTFTEADALKLFKAVDANGDGKVDYSEFLRWVLA